MKAWGQEVAAAAAPGRRPGVKSPRGGPRGKDLQEIHWTDGGFPSLAESCPSPGLCVQKQMWKEQRFLRDSSCSWVSDVLVLGRLGER